MDDAEADADLAAARRFYAEEVRFSANIAAPALVEAFATVPRERFLGPGPWRCGGIDSWMGGDRGYFPTPDASPRHVYHNVIVSIDPARELNNGHPGTLAAWIDALGRALMAGTWSRVRGLTRAAHEQDEACWLHGKGWCLRTEE